MGILLEREGGEPPVYSFADFTSPDGEDMELGVLAEHAGRWFEVRNVGHVLSDEIPYWIRVVPEGYDDVGTGALDSRTAILTREGDGLKWGVAMQTDRTGDGKTIYRARDTFPEAVSAAFLWVGEGLVVPQRGMSPKEAAAMEGAAL